jgi:hypothetical protein
MILCECKRLVCAVAVAEFVACVCEHRARTKGSLCHLSALPLEPAFALARGPSLPRSLPGEGLSQPASQPTPPPRAGAALRGQTRSAPWRRRRTRAATTGRRPCRRCVGGKRRRSPRRASRSRPTGRASPRGARTQEATSGSPRPPLASTSAATTCQSRPRSAPARSGPRGLPGPPSGSSLPPQGRPSRCAESGASPGECWRRGSTQGGT